MRWQAALIAMSSRPVTAQRVRLYLRCFFTGTGQAAVSRRTRFTDDGFVRSSAADGVVSCMPSRPLSCRKRAGDALPFGVARQRFLGAVASGTEIEDLRVAGVDAQRALLARCDACR